MLWAWVNVAGVGQQELWIAADQLARTPRHVFYEKLNRLLVKAEFDAWFEELCRPYYAEEGRRSIPPGVYFRMLLVGYFEGIDFQRAIAWRCADSLSLKAFLGYAPTESTPNHSSLTKIRERLPVEIYGEMLQFVLSLVEKHKLLSATVVGVDSTTLDANAAMKSIVRRDTPRELAPIRHAADVRGRPDWSGGRTVGRRTVVV